MIDFWSLNARKAPSRGVLTLGLLLPLASCFIDAGTSESSGDGDSSSESSGDGDGDRPGDGDGDSPGDGDGDDSGDGDGDSPGDGDGDSESSGDGMPPTVLSVSPQDGAVAVLEDAEIVIAFSEAMNQTATEAAFSSGDIAPGSVTFSWNGAGDTLTITPDTPLAYAEGSDDSVEALSFALSVSIDARDESGEHLGDPFDSSFSTARHIVAQLERIGSLSGRVNEDGLTGIDAMLIGDDFTNIWLRSLLTFEFDELPNTVVQWNFATLSCDQMNVTCSGFSMTPYDDLGDLGVFDVVYNTLNVEAAESGGLEIGVLSNNVVIETKTLDVSDEAEDDFPSQRSQFLLRFDSNTDNDDNRDCVAFDVDSARLEVDFLAE